MTLLSPSVIGILMLDAIFLIFGLLAWIIAWQIVLKWNPSSATPLQYTLQKRSYLVATIVEFIFFLKLPLFLFYIHTLDEIATVLPGAMCAAGVTTATVYGVPLFFVKILNLYLFGLWIVLHRLDMARPDLPYTRLKFAIFLPLFLLLAVETGLEWLQFTHINPHVIVSCCGTLFSATKNTAVATFVSLPLSVTLGLFYGLFLGIVIAGWRKMTGLLAFLNLLFVPTAILSLIAFFSTYVYELPHHHCPFCLLQSDYHYIGYLIYTALFAGTFGGMAAWLVRRLGGETWRTWLYTSMAGDFLYVALVSYYPIAYYLKNGVWM